MLAAKRVMRQSIFEGEAAERDDPVVQAIRAAEERWRAVALAGLVVGGTGLLAGVVAAALVVGGLAAVDRFRGGARSPTVLAGRVVAALDARALRLRRSITLPLARETLAAHKGVDDLGG